LEISASSTFWVTSGLGFVCCFVGLHLEPVSSKVPGSKRKNNQPTQMNIQRFINASSGLALIGSR
jgi:hypothetical protein